MPTFEAEPRFLRDYRALSKEQKRLFAAAVRLFVLGLKTRRLPAGLRVKRVQGAIGVWELTWAPNGRATFEYGDELRAGDVHVIWRRIGTHEVFDRP